jgi:hypothetical protein
MPWYTPVPEAFSRSLNSSQGGLDKNFNVFKMGRSPSRVRSASLCIRRHIFLGVSARAFVAVDLHGAHLLDECFLEYQRDFTQSDS